MADKKWYPENVRVPEEGSVETLQFMKKAFRPLEHFAYAEFGIWKADTAAKVCQMFPNATLFLFDYEENISAARRKLEPFPNKVHYFSNSQRYNDSYNWSLGKLIGENGAKPIFDYCFLDGAHTYAVDALNYFLCDRLLRTNGYVDFDDYKWRLRGSSLDPSILPEIALQYTEEQIDALQVKMIVDTLVKTDPRYVERYPNRVYQKISA